MYNAFSMYNSNISFVSSAEVSLSTDAEDSPDDIPVLLSQV